MAHFHSILSMAIFTTVSESDAQTLLSSYQIGSLKSLVGISKGIDNTNYFLTTDESEFVLTIFERLTFEQLPFYIELMNHLAQKGIPVPHPQTQKNGERIATMHNKPCGIVSKLEGSWHASPNEAHCALVGDTLAKLHLAGQDFSLTQKNLLTLDWWNIAIPKILPFIPEELQSLLTDEFMVQKDYMASDEYLNLPSGAIHGDLFRDNVMFVGSDESPVMGGFLDFYFAATETWLYDVAVAVNDWCIDLDTGEFDLKRLHAFIHAYQAVRPFTNEEQTNWDKTLRAAALRFWVSRLYDFYLPRPAETLIPHDPAHFQRILQLRRQGSPSLTSL